MALFFKCEPQPLQEHVAAVLDARGWRVKGVDGENSLLISANGDEGSVCRVSFVDRKVDGDVLPIGQCFGVDPNVVSGCTSVELAPIHGEDPGDPVERLRGMASIALALVYDRTVAIWWGGARSLMSPELFERSTGIWLADGAFPALGFTALERGNGGIIRSIGLGLLAGQEIAVHPGGLAKEPSDQARLAIRVIDFLVREGPLMQSQVIEVEGFGTVRFELDQNKGDINLYC